MVLNRGTLNSLFINVKPVCPWVLAKGASKLFEQQERLPGIKKGCRKLAQKIGQSIIWSKLHHILYFSSPLFPCQNRSYKDVVYSPDICRHYLWRRVWLCRSTIGRLASSPRTSSRRASPSPSRQSCSLEATSLETHPKKQKMDHFEKLGLSTMKRSSFFEWKPKQNQIEWRVLTNPSSMKQSSF